MYFYINSGGKLSCQDSRCQQEMIHSHYTYPPFCSTRQLVSNTVLATHHCTWLEWPLPKATRCLHCHQVSSSLPETSRYKCCWARVLVSIDGLELLVRRSKIKRKTIIPHFQQSQRPSNNNLHFFLKLTTIPPHHTITPHHNAPHRTHWTTEAEQSSLSI